MKKYLMFFKLQIKSVFLSVPAIIAGTVAFAAVMAFAAAGMGSVAMKNSQPDKLSVAVVISEGKEADFEGRYIKKAFEALSQVEAVNKKCEFVMFDSENEAIEDLSKAKVGTVIVIPEKFISSILTGENRPARIIYEESGVTTSSEMFMDLIRAAASDLSTVQAGIYAVDDVCSTFVLENGAQFKAEAYLNAKYLAYALDRNVYFESVDIRTEDNFTVPQYYASTAIVMVLLLSSITCVGIFKSDGIVLERALKRSGVAQGSGHCFKVIGVSLVYWIVFGIVFLFGCLSVMRFSQMGSFFTVVGNPEADSVYEIMNDKALTGFFVSFLCIGLLMISVFSFAGFILKISDKAVTGVILIFILSLIMMFASGCFVPVSMLPEMLADVGRVLPTYWYFKLCGQIIAGGVSIDAVLVNLAYSALFLALSAAVEKIICRSREV